MVFKNFKKPSEKSLDEKKSLNGKKFGKKAKVALLIVIFLLILGGGGFFAYENYFKKADISSENLNAEQVQDLLAEVGEKIELPKDETPTVATVTDVTKLQDQQFFKNAQNGDKVIVYQSTQKAILYRPSTGKIIDISPVNLSANNPGQAVAQSTESATLGEATGNVTPTPEEAQKLSVVVLNSTKESGLAKKGANLLDEEKYEVTTSNSSGEYDVTSVVIINKNTATKNDASEIANSLTKVEAKVSNLPADEAAPAGADIVVILGNDFSDAY